MKNLKQYAFAILFALAIISCEKEETLETTNQNIEEVNDQIDGEALQMEVLLSKSYDASLSKEEIDVAFDKEVAAYLSANKNTQNRATRSFRVRATTVTGTQPNDDSNGVVDARFFFKTNRGNLSTSYSRLNVNGVRAKGAVHRHLLSFSLSSSRATEWFEADKVRVRFRGQNIWGVDLVEVQMRPQDQSSSATGNTLLTAFPNEKLQSSCSGCFDYYNSSNSDSSKLGRITFN